MWLLLLEPKTSFLVKSIDNLVSFFFLFTKMLPLQNQSRLIDEKRMFQVVVQDTILNKSAYVTVWIYSEEIVSFTKLRSELYNLGFRLTRYQKNGRDQSMSHWITVDPGSYAVFPASNTYKYKSQGSQFQRVLEILKKYKVPVSFSKHQQNYLDAISLIDAPTQVLVTYVPPTVLPFFMAENILKNLLFSITANSRAKTLTKW